MQEQNQQEVSFLADDSNLGSMPYLSGLFDAIDDLINDCAKEHNADLTQLRRYVAGHVAKDDLMEFQGKFDIVGEKIKPTTDWNALMSMTKKRPRFHEDDNAEVRQLTKILNAESTKEAQELRIEVEKKKKELSEQKQAKKDKKNDDAAARNDSFRLKEYSKDMKKLENSMKYMLVNYGSHILFACVNEEENKQTFYPPFASGNSGRNKHFTNFI